MGMCINFTLDTLYPLDPQDKIALNNSPPWDMKGWICPGLWGYGNRWNLTKYKTFPLYTSQVICNTMPSKNSGQHNQCVFHVLMRPSKGGSLVTLSHPSVYLCHLTSGENCRCRFSVQIHMSLSLQKFVPDVSIR